MSTTWQLENEMNKLVMEFETAILNEYDFAAAKKFTRLMNEFDSNEHDVLMEVNSFMHDVYLDHIIQYRSTWSGGHCVKNMCEQMRRDIASSRIRSPYHSYNAAALKNIISQMKEA
jgi:hypothetical protein